MISYFKTVKKGVIVLMLIFAVLITSIVSIFNFYLIYTYQKQNIIKSTEFNIQLVANIVEKDLTEITSLLMWCSNNKEIIKYIDIDNNNIYKEGVNAYNVMNKEFINSKVMSYVRRLIVVSNDFNRFLQVGNFVSSSEPINIYNIKKVKEYSLDTNSKWQTLNNDHLYMSDSPLVFPLTTPIYSNESNEEIGVVYLLVSTTVITDKLKGYSLQDNSKLYLTLESGTFEIIGENFIKSKNIFEITKKDNISTYSKDTNVHYIKDKNNKNYLSVSYPIRDNVTLTQIIPTKELLIIENNWLILLVLICILILLLSLIATYNLDKNISKPIANLKKRIDLISEGDFSFDPKIESNNELGQVGIGINKLSQEVVLLMNSKIEDEKNKRMLEYKMLQNQINPHFLYNTLNSIKMMAIIQSADGIAEMSTALSKLLRTLSKDMRRLVPLKDELELLDTYMVIQKYRYSDSVTLIKNIEDEYLLKTLIPRFSLQPIVENAIFHGIAPKGKGVIIINIKKINDIVYCSLTDDGVGISKENIENILNFNLDKKGILNSIGIKNVDERLKYAFGNNFGINIQSELNKYTTMTINLPLNNIGDEYV